jgi:hypothetical protein
LLLGTNKHPTLTLGRTNYGMILVEQRNDKYLTYWRRLGIVRWEVFDLPRGINVQDKLLLKGQSEDWVLLTGIFG